MRGGEGGEGRGEEGRGKGGRGEEGRGGVVRCAGEAGKGRWCVQ